MSSAPKTSSRPSRGAELELTVDQLAYGGKGIARRDGYVIFVTGAVAGDRVLARVSKSKKDYAEARAIEVLEPSSDRIDPVADHPGAAWQVLRYERQLEIKHQQVAEALTRIGKLTDFALEPIIPAQQQWRYRNKLEYSFGQSAQDGSLICGFHAPGHFDQIVPVADCMLASERGNALREQVLAWCRDQGLGAWDRREQRGFLRNLVVREGRRTGQFQVRLVTSPGDIAADSLAEAVDCDTLFLTQTDGLGESTMGGKTFLVKGPPQLEEHLGELRFLISPDAFFQTNTEMAEVLYATAVEFADFKGTERVFDLFCGIGTIALTVAPHVKEVVGVELVESAAADAIENATLNKIDNTDFYTGDIRTSMRPLVEQCGSPDVVIVDPPRAGLSQKIVRRIAETKPEKIVYVSCNPTTLAANAAQLATLGFHLQRIRPVDMFPQTPHIECVALFERTAGAGESA